MTLFLCAGVGSYGAMPFFIWYYHMILSWFILQYNNENWGQMIGGLWRDGGWYGNMNTDLVVCILCFFSLKPMFICGF